MLDSILISGIILMPWKMPAGSVWVFASTLDRTEVASTQTDDDGRFQFKLSHEDKGIFSFYTSADNIIYSSPEHKVFFHQDVPIVMKVDRKEFIRVKVCLEYTPSTIIDSTHLVKLSNIKQSEDFSLFSLAHKTSWEARQKTCDYYYIRKSVYLLCYRKVSNADFNRLTYAPQLVYAKIGRRKYGRHYSKFADYVVPIEIKNRKTIHLYINQKEPDW